MAQINQYANEAANIKDDDFFDLDLETSPGVYQSNKLKWGTIKTQLTIDRPELLRNLSNFNLTQTDNLRIYDADNGDLRYENLDGLNFDITGSGATGKKTTFFGLTTSNVKMKTESTLTKDIAYVYPSGTRAYRHSEPTATYWFGDTSGIATWIGSQPQTPFLATFISQDKKTCFTDSVLPPATVDINDSVAWFRSTTKGVLFPNLTEAARNAIPTPRLGLVIFNTTANALQVFDNSMPTGWKSL